MDFGRLDLVSSGAQVLQMLGGALMALGYLAWFVRGLQHPGLARWLGLMAPAGRMALTNYLLQSSGMRASLAGQARRRIRRRVDGGTSGVPCT